MPFASRWTPPTRLRDREPGPLPAKPERVGVLARIADTVIAAPKTKPWRCRAVLDLARGRECLLCVPGVCQDRCGETTVACHSNMSRHGKAGARKADDFWSVWGCAACHEWLDRGPAPEKSKMAIFYCAHVRQKLHWRKLASDPSESAAVRRAAGKAMAGLAEWMLANGQRRRGAQAKASQL